MNVLVVGRHGPLDTAVQTLLETQFGLDQVLVSPDVRTLNLEGDDHTPRLVVLCPSLAAHEYSRQLAWIKRAWPAAHCLALVNGEEQQQIVSAGADDVVFVGTPFEEFCSAVKRAVSLL
jgi:DNA-binding NarL/FixJ family response regulator